MWIYLVFHSLTRKAVFWISTWEKACAENLALMSLSPLSLGVSGITLGNSKSLQELNKIMLHFNLLISENYLGFRSSLGVHTQSDMSCTETFSLWTSSSGLHPRAPLLRHTWPKHQINAPLAWSLSLLHIMGLPRKKLVVLWHPGHPKPVFAMCGTDMRPVSTQEM